MRIPRRGDYKTQIEYLNAFALVAIMHRLGIIAACSVLVAFLLAIAVLATALGEL